ncbi:hypothetical protein HK097_003264 [Rhizophlyctis rosea]|uniref:Uncharacterized protein n=1 Tax=Rhizophlyctis rosea TaxID=64517 RepID=A0AAD5S4E0_9FUNG|nr:hypothetical protein HK097_003264 [Rhizophlyctis rosea]
MTSHQNPSLADSGFISPTTSALLQLQKAAERGKYTAADWEAYAVYLHAIDNELEAGNEAEALRLSRRGEELGFESGRCSETALMQMRALIGAGTANNGTMYLIMRRLRQVALMDQGIRRS